MGTSTPAGRTSEDGSPAGDTIRRRILDNWDKYEKVNLYFEGVFQMTRPFCDEAFAKVLEEHSLEEFNEKAPFPGRQRPHRETTERCLEDSSQNHQVPERTGGHAGRLKISLGVILFW